MRTLRDIATLAWKELVVLARDRQAAVLLFGMPAVFVLFLSLALKEVYGEKIGVQLGLVLESEDEGGFARSIAESLRAGGDFRLVARPSGVSNAELFRSGAAHAAVRIPAGFSADLEALLASDGAGQFGPHKIEWEASPSLDAAYRWLVEARLAMTCMRLLQEQLEHGQMELGAKLTEMGEEMDRMGKELEAMGAELEQTGAELEKTGAQLEETGALLTSTSQELERTIGLLESAAALLSGTRKQLEEAAVAAVVEQAANAEAEATRLALAQRGALPEGVRLDEPPRPALSFEPPEPGRPRPARTRTVRAAAGAAGEPRSGAAKIALVADTPEIEEGAELFLSEGKGERSIVPTPLQQTVPGWSLFAMFFIVVPLSQGLHRERADGTLRRILGLGVGRGAIVLGKLLPFVLVGLLQFAGMLAVGLYVLPLFSDLSLDLGSSPATLIPITLACALAASSFGLLVATLARTPEQAAAVGATSVVILAVLGGVMVPHFVMPAVLQRLALASPLYWGHKAYLDFFVHHAGLAEVARELAVLLGFALACLALAARRVARPSA